MLSVKTLYEHAPSIPIYVISGFLGSGKTTFLQGLLAYTASQGLKPAILMNDYGDVSTDSDRLRGQGYPTKTFADGCICCTLRPDLHSALTDLMTGQPDVIFIEATGLADPVRLLDQLTQIEMLSRAFVAAMIAVIDARGSSQQMAGYGLHSFTETADFVLINKCDLAHWMQLARTAQEVCHKNSRAKMLLTTYAEVDFAEVLSQQGTQAAPTIARAPQHDHFHTLTYRAPCSFIPEPFAEVMQALPDEVWRAKGFVRFHDSSKQWELQYTGKEFFIGQVALTPQPQDHLVFIGAAFDRSALLAALDSCLVPH